MSTDSPSSIRLDESAYMKERVDDQLAYYEKSANKAKHWYTWMQSSIIILAILVPIIVNMPSEVGLDFLAPHIKVLVTILSLLLAILNGLLNFQKHQDLWLGYRITGECLKHEKYLYLTRSGKYRQHESPFSEFVLSIESILSAEHHTFKNLIQSDKKPVGEST